MNYYEQEQNNILSYFINNIESQWVDGKDSDDVIPFLEFFITPQCNQSCSYCYLVKYKNLLYPDKIKNEDILNNLNIYLNYLFNKGINRVYRLDLFLEKYGEQIQAMEYLIYYYTILIKAFVLMILLFLVTVVFVIIKNI